MTPPVKQRFWHLDHLAFPPFIKYMFILCKLSFQVECFLRSWNKKWLSTLTLNVDPSSKNTVDLLKMVHFTRNVVIWNTTLSTHRYFLSGKVRENFVTSPKSHPYPSLIILQFLSSKWDEENFHPVTQCWLLSLKSEWFTQLCNLLQPKLAVREVAIFAKANLDRVSQKPARFRFHEWNIFRVAVWV